MSRRQRSRQVEIFNFSFLDILACTIGLLIFIMVMVFILQSSSPVADTSGIVARKLDRLSDIQARMRDDEQIASGLEAQLQQVQALGEPNLTTERDAAVASRDQAKARYEQALRAQADAQARLDAATMAQQQWTTATERAQAELSAAHERQNRARAVLADAKDAASDNGILLLPRMRPGDLANAFDVLHVDCRADALVLYINQKGRLVQAGRTPLAGVQSPSSDFARLVADQRQHDNGLILFWIRPDGGPTYAAAREALPTPTTVGYEPADAKWVFGSPQQ